MASCVCRSGNSYRALPLKARPDIVFADQFDEGLRQGTGPAAGFLTAPEDMLKRARETPVIQARDTSRRNSPVETGELHYFKGLDAPWLGREGSNLRMAESKSAALPLGYAPTGHRDWRKNRLPRIPSGRSRSIGSGAAFQPPGEAKYHGAAACARHTLLWTRPRPVRAPPTH